MASSDDRSLPGFSLPQWIRGRTMNSYELDDLAFSPPLDDDTFIHLKRRSGPPSRRSSGTASPQLQAGSGGPQVVVVSSASTPAAVAVGPPPPPPPYCPHLPDKEGSSIHLMESLEKANLLPSPPTESPPPSPALTPQPSPQPPRRCEEIAHHKLNPYFTGSVAADRPTVGTPSWFFTGNVLLSGAAAGGLGGAAVGGKRGGRLEKHSMGRSKSASTEDQETDGKKGGKVPKPSRMREMNFLSPMSM